MNGLRKVLVVDSGQRSEIDLLSTELAELGLSSVTASFEAAEAVLEVIDRPSAIFVNMPTLSDSLAGLRELAAALRRSERAIGVPVIEWNCEAALRSGGVSEMLRDAIGPRVLNGPEL